MFVSSSSLAALLGGVAGGAGVALAAAEPFDFSAAGDDPDDPLTSDEEGHRASPLQGIDDAHTLCEDVMEALHAGETESAFDQLRPPWGFSDEEMTALQREVERTRAVVADRYGHPIDFTLLQQKEAGNILIRFTYLERFQRHGLRWQFTFYKGESGWTLNDVSFDDEIEALLC